MPSYRFTLDGTPVCDLDLESLRLSLRAGGPDTLVWSYQADPTGTPPHEIHDEVTLTCLTYDDEGEITATEILFKGHVTRAPKIDEGTTAGFQYQAENGWGDMRRVVFTQTWKSWDPTLESLLDREVPRTVLGLDSAGAIQTTGDTLEEIVDRAEAKGALVTAGTISPALTVPPTEIVDTSCDAAFRQLMAYHPDHVAWIEDGEILNVRPPSALSTLTVDPCDDGVTISHDPQTDELPGGVVIVWEITHEADGVERIERIHQTAGSTSGWPPPLYMTIPLRGTSVTTKKEVIETRTLPVAGETSEPYANDFFRGLLPQLADATDEEIEITTYSVDWADPRLDYLDEEAEEETVNPNSRPIDRGTDEVTDFPRMLVSGQVQPWFPSNVKQYDALLKATILYTGSDPAIRDYVGSGLEICEPIVITNATPRTYRALETLQNGEEPITGLAASYWAAISQAKNEGTISGHLDARWIDLRPGRKVIVTGYYDDAAVISAMELDVLQKSFSTTYGTSEYLNPKTIADLARSMARNKPSWRRPEERTQALAEGGSPSAIREGGKSSPQYAHPRPKNVARYWGLTITDSAAGKFKLADPGRIKKTTALDASGNVPIVGVTTEFTAEIGKILCLSVDPDFTTTLQMVDEEWTGWPYGYEIQETTPPGLWVWTKYYYPLYDFVEGVSDQPDAVVVKPATYDGETLVSEAISAEFRGYDKHLMFIQCETQTSAGQVVAAHELLPSVGSRKTAS